jgi:acyl carrier protein
MENNQSLEHRIKKCIIDRLSLRVTPDEIDDNAPIFNMKNIENMSESEMEEVGLTPEMITMAKSAGDSDLKGLELDSIDSLEIVVALSNEFNVEIGDDDMMIFQSINTIADFIREKIDIE